VIPAESLLPKPSSTVPQPNAVAVVSQLVCREADELVQLFDREDGDGDGVLTAAEVHVFLRACGVAFDPRQVRHVLERHSFPAG
jgi:hypothetical protein